MSDIRTLPASQTERADFEWGELIWFAGRRLGNSEDLTVGQCTLRPGKANPRHRHPNCSEVLVVIRGRVSHTAADGATVQLNKGDTVTIPANIWHSAQNIGEEDAVLFISFSSADRETQGE